MHVPRIRTEPDHVQSGEALSRVFFPRVSGDSSEEVIFITLLSVKGDNGS